MLKRQNLSNFILKGRGLLKILTVITIIIVYKAKAVKLSYN